MDNILWEVLEIASSSSIPRAEEGKSWECVVDVPGLHRRTFQDWVARQPIKLGGLGLRYQADLSPATFVGALEQTLPSFIGEKGICPQLSHLVGDLGNVNQRWRPLFTQGAELGWSWTEPGRSYKMRLEDWWASWERSCRALYQLKCQELERAVSKVERESG